MSPRRTARATTLSESLSRARRRLTAWYAGTLFAILVLLGVGLFATITARFDRELDRSLIDDVQELVRVASARDRASPLSNSGAGTLIDAATDIRIPDRQLYLLDTLGQPVAGPPLVEWLQTLARDAWRSRSFDATFSSGERILRGHGEGFTVPSGRSFVAIAVADEIELEDRYASLIATFSLLSLAAVVLVAVGGWILAGKTTAPVEAAFVHMRRFMADAAHELRTPLTILRGRAEVALQRPRDLAEYTETLQAIEEDTTRLGRIVEDLLMLARADAGERAIDKKRVFLDDIALDAANAARVIAERKSIQVAVGDFEEAPVVGDATLLRQLVLILLDNAIKFNRPGGAVQVSVAKRGASAVLTVSDTGIGIPLEQLPHVFDRFFRGDASRSRESTGAEGGVSEGVGLGLSIARWIAEEHSATITIDSRVAQGTRVVVEFPVPVGESTEGLGGGVSSS